MKKIRLYILSGIFGSGKTTILQRILENLEGKKVGVIQNELGKLSIDGRVLRDEDIQMVELTRGSIFCSCLKLSFVQALTELSQKDLDCVIVESSGFGDPSNLEEILEAAKITAGDRYELCGVVCLVDALNFPDQADSLDDGMENETVGRQIRHCHLAVVTKVDLAEPEQVAAIRARIREINPVCPIVESANGDLDLSFLEEDLLRYRWAASEASTNSVETKPKTLFLNFEGAVPEEKLRAFLQVMSPDVHRIKGFFCTEEAGWRKVDLVGRQIELVPCEEQELSQLVIISRIGTAVIRKIMAVWEEEVGLPMKLKN